MTRAIDVPDGIGGARRGRSHLYWCKALATTARAASKQSE